MNIKFSLPFIQQFYSVLSNLIEDLKRIWNLKVLHFQIATFSNFQIHESITHPKKPDSGGQWNLTTLYC